MTRRTFADLEKPVELSREEIEVDRIFAVALTTPDGRKALAAMHQLTTFKRNKPDDSDGALREMEAQRRFVAILEARIERHTKRAVVPAAETVSGGRDGEQSGSRRRRTRSRAS